MITACGWCKRETVNGAPRGIPLWGKRYETASHGNCNECAEDFEAGLSREKIIERAKARIELVRT